MLVHAILHRNHFCIDLILLLWEASCLGNTLVREACQSLTPFKQSVESLLFWSIIDIGKYMGGRYYVPEDDNR